MSVRKAYTKVRGSIYKRRRTELNSFTQLTDGTDQDRHRHGERFCGRSQADLLPRHPSRGGTRRVQRDSAVKRNFLQIIENIERVTGIEPV